MSGAGVERAAWSDVAAGALHGLLGEAPRGTNTWMEDAGFGLTVCAQRRVGKRWKTARALVTGTDEAAFRRAKHEAFRILDAAVGRRP